MKIINFSPAISFPFRPVVTIGAFDGVHRGHQSILQILKNEAPKESIVITFENHPRFLLDKFPENFRLLSSEKEKRALIEKQGIENLLLLSFNQETASLSAADFVQKILIEKLNIRGLILGYDNHFGNKTKGHFEEVFLLAEQHNIFIKKTEPLVLDGITVSSTQIRNALNEGNILLANNMLGYPYSIEAKVIEGMKIGQTLGFRTANLQLLDERKLIPGQGVYAVWVRYKNRILKGMMSIGKRLTFGLEDISLEVHILDFNEMIYGETVEVVFEEKYREIEKFSSKEALIEQLYADKETAQNILANKQLLS